MRMVVIIYLFCCKYKMIDDYFECFVWLDVIIDCLFVSGVDVVIIYL